MSSSTQNFTSTSNGLTRQVSNSLGLSISPSTTFRSPTSSYGGAQLSRTSTGAFGKQLKPFKHRDIKILLLENVNKTGRDTLTDQGYQVDFYKTSLPEDELIEKIRWRTSSLS